MTTTVARVTAAASARPVPTACARSKTVATGQQEVYAVATDASNVYFSAGGTINAIRFIDKGLIGMPAPLISMGAARPREIVINGNDMVYAFRGINNSGRVGHSNPPDAMMTSTIHNALAGPWGVTADATFMYWADVIDNGIYREPIPETPGNPQQIASNVAGSAPQDLEVSSSHVYWTNYGNGEIRRVVLAGGMASEVVANGQSSPFGLALDTTHIYWSTEQGGEIKRQPIAGGAEEVIATAQVQPSYIAVDNGNVYWTNFGSGVVSRAPVDGSAAPLVIAAGQNEPFHVAVDATHVYWTTLGGGTVMRAPK